MKQRAKLLIARPDFQKDMLKLRQKWEIPKEGLKDEDENQQWRHNFNKSDDDFVKNEWPKYRKGLEKLEKHGNFFEHEKRLKEINSFAPLNAFRLDIKALIKKYRLPLRWESSLQRYLLFNDADNMSLHIGITMSTTRDEDTNLDILRIEIEDDTTLEDIKASWKDIKHHQRKLNSRTQEKFQPIKNFERDKRAYELDHSGKMLKEIAVILNKEAGKEYEWSDVSKFIERHRKKLGIN